MTFWDWFWVEPDKEIAADERQIHLRHLLHRQIENSKLKLKRVNNGAVNIKPLKIERTPAPAIVNPFSADSRDMISELKKELGKRNKKKRNKTRKKN